MAANLFGVLMLKLPLKVVRVLSSFWPPFLGMAIKVDAISPDFLSVDVSMKLHWYNKNYVGTQFGGAIYSMTDPFYMLMLVKNLGSEYIVWDKAAKIDFIKPGREKLIANFRFTADEIIAIRDQANQNTKYVFDKQITVTTVEGEIIATVIKTLYVRHKDPLVAK